MRCIREALFISCGNPFELAETRLAAINARGLCPRRDTQSNTYHGAIIR